MLRKRRSGADRRQNKSIEMVSEGAADGRRRVISATEEALLFAAGGDYVPARRATVAPGEGPAGLAKPAFGDEANEIFKDLGRVRRKRWKTFNKMDRLKKSLEAETMDTQSVEIELTGDMSSNSEVNKKSKYGSNLEIIKKETRALRDELNTTEAAMLSIQQKIAEIPTVRAEQKRARNPASKNEFIRDIFTSVREGDLESLKVRVAALDLESPNDAGLKHLTEPSSELPILHVALMCQQDAVANFLISHAGCELARQSVASGDCDKLTPFYIAVLHGNVDIVRRLLESLNDANERAEVINDIVTYTTDTHKGTVVEEWPLTNVIRAHSVDTEAMYEMFAYLVENGADLATQTPSDGNTLMHHLVMESTNYNCSRVPYFRNVLNDIIVKVAARWWQKKCEAMHTITLLTREEDNRVQAMKHLLNMKNNNHETPITLAAKLDSPIFLDFCRMENVMRFSDPKFGRFLQTSQTYDVTDMTSLNEDGRYSRNSVLHIIAHNVVSLSDSQEKEDLLTNEPLKSIIKYKWSVYRYVFYLIGILHIIHMSVFTNVAFSHNAGNNSCFHARPMYDWKHHVLYLLFLVMPLVYIVSEIVDLFALRGAKVKCPAHGNVLFRSIAILFSLMTIAWYVLHELVHNVPIPPEFVAMTLLLGWVFMLFFTRGVILPYKNIQIGLFSSMMHRMFFFDVVPFAIIAFIILVAFSTAFHSFILVADIDENFEYLVKMNTTYLSPHMHGYDETLYLMVKYLCGLPNPMDYEESSGYPFARFLLAFYGLITVVLLINMLIAAMNTSYERIRSCRFNPIYRQRLSVTLLVERRMPTFIRRRTQRNLTVMHNPRTGRVEQFLRVSDH